MELPETYLALRSHAPGEPKIDQIPLPKPQKNQVVVKMEYAPLNPTDLGAMRGGYRYFLSFPYLVGMEGSGTVVALGEDLKVPHNIGDKVHVIAVEPTGKILNGTIGQYIVLSSELCDTIKENVSLEEAACHFVNPATVYHMGVVAERGGHKAAIHTAGSSALGRMLIRYFKHKGIKLINVVRKDEYIEELKKEGADYVLNSQAPDFEAQLKEIAAKENATLAFDAICGDFTSKIVRNQPPNSICYVYGALSGQFEINNIGIMDLFQGKKVAGLVYMDYLKEVSQTEGAFVKFFNEIHSLLPTVFKSSIQKVFRFDELQDALAFYHENSSKGKILLKLN